MKAKDEIFSSFFIINWKKMIFFTRYPKQNFENFFSSKISLWVLKRIVLTRWKRFLIFEIHQRSFRTRIRHDNQLNIRFFNNGAYSDMERSLANFRYQKTFAACQEDSFKYPQWHFWRKKIILWALGEKIIFLINDVK